MTRPIRSRILFFTGLLFFFAIPAGAQRALSPEDQVKSRIVDFLDAFNTLDSAKLHGLFAADATLFAPMPEVAERQAGEDVAATFDDIFEEIANRQKGPPYLTMIAENVDVRIMGNTAVASFHIRGGRMLSRRTLIFQKQKGAWSIVHMHASNLRPPPQAGGE